MQHLICRTIIDVIQLRNASLRQINLNGSPHIRAEARSHGTVRTALLIKSIQMKIISAAPKLQPKSVLMAAWQGKCPKCLAGQMFNTPIYTLHGQQMNKVCPHCGFYFEVEPGYFYVSMFVSYALNVAQMVTLSVGTYLLTGSKNPWLYSSLLISVAFLLSPFNFRYSRGVLLFWLTPGVHYEPRRAAPDYNPSHPNE